MSQMHEVSGIRYATHVSMEVDLEEVMTKLETLRALRDAIKKERKLLHRVVANVARSKVDASVIKSKKCSGG